MNKTCEQEIRFHLFKILSQESNLTQRDMAKKMGISLGKANYCISELAKKGFIKINRLKVSKNKIRYFYMLTPRGVEEKARLTLSFLNRKISEFEEIKRQIKELTQEVEENKTINFSETETRYVMRRIP